MTAKIAEEDRKLAEVIATAEICAALRRPEYRHRDVAEHHAGNIVNYLIAAGWRPRTSEVAP